MGRYVTREGLEKIKQELVYLKNDKRNEISERLKFAISLGDLSENASYTEAKEAQGFLEGKIAELEDIVRNAIIIEELPRGDTVEIGAFVVLQKDSDEERYRIVGPEEADPDENKISFSSPMGKILMGKKVGEETELTTPSGKVLKLKILKIE